MRKARRYEAWRQDMAPGGWAGVKAVLDRRPACRFPPQGRLPMAVRSRSANAASALPRFLACAAQGRRHHQVSKRRHDLGKKKHDAGRQDDSER